MRMNLAKSSFFTVALVLLSTFLAGCGGGSGGDTVSTACRATMLNPDTCDTTLKLTLKDASGVLVAELPQHTAATVQALLTYKDGKGVPGVVVTFSTSDQSVPLPNFGAATTDATGLATLALPTSSKSGSFTISADAPVNGAHTRAVTNYAVTTKLLTLKLALTDAFGVEVKHIPQYSAATLKAFVTDSDGKGAAGVEVNFNTSDLSVSLPNFGTATTDASGWATMALPASSKFGSFTISVDASADGAHTLGATSYAVTAKLLTLKLALTDAFGVEVKQIPQHSAGTLRASVTDVDGTGAQGVQVTFNTSDPSVALLNFGTATTDATGRATMALPASTKFGSFTISADASANGAHTLGATNYSVTAKSLTLKLALTDAFGVEVKQIPQYSAGTLQASVTDIDGTGAMGIQVTFNTSDPTVALPRFGTAKTNANGLATMELPASLKSGSFTGSANASFNDAALAGTTNYVVTFQTLTLSALTITPSSLSAGGNASVGVTVSSGGQPYLPSTPVTFTSPCITAGKAVMGPAILTKSGVAIGSYTDKGCSTADNITASVNFGDIQTTRSGTVNVLPATAGSIKFISADTTNISLKGTGGVGRQEYSTLTFEVHDIAGNTVTGALVNLSFANGSAVGGLTLTPPFATTDANGRVTTTVSAGTIPTSVRVIATANGITTLSDVLVISTGVPDQNHFSLSGSDGNCEGRDFDQFCSTYTVTMGDHFGNPVPDGTAVNFTTNGGVIDASCLTGSVPITPAGQSTNSKVGSGSGTCSVRLLAASPRPPSGRVIVLAYALP